MSKKHEEVPAIRDQANTVTASSIELLELEWIWQGRIPKGKLTLIAGDPGCGKSLLHVDIATRITNGSPWPVDRVAAAYGSVLILTAEDDLADTYVPRLKAAGANLDKVKFLTTISQPDPEQGFRKRLVNLRQDVQRIEEAVRAMDDCIAVLIDPLSAYIGSDVDSHRDTEVRSILAPLADMAQTTRVAVIGIMHFNKGQGKAMYRLIGSIGFTAAARMVWVVVRDHGDDRDDRDHKDPGRRLMLPLKMNLAKEAGGLAYSIVEESVEGLKTRHPVIAWEPDPVTDIDMEAALGPPPKVRPRDEAKAWLQHQLSDGIKPVADLQSAAERDGLKWHTVERAKKDLGVVSVKSAFAEGWYWALPEQLIAAKAANTAITVTEQ